MRDVYLCIDANGRHREFLLTAPNEDGTKSYERWAGNITIHVTARELEGMLAKAVYEQAMRDQS